jgi:HEAT repeat protein
MRRPDPTESALDALREATDMTPFLRHKSNLVVAKAATRAVGCTQAMVEAFRRLMEDPAKRDPGCVAKIAIAKRLVETEEAAAEVYFAGSRHVQLEAVWGGQEDMARELRGICVIGLVRMGYPEALLEAVRLLSDPAPEARTGAIRALAESGKSEAELVLRFKAKQGDRKIEVTGECFAALLRLGPRVRSLPYIADFLESRDQEIAEAAAIALGESRMAEAWPILRDAFARPGNQSIHGAVMLGVAMLRIDEGIEFLIDRVANDRDRMGAAAIEALALYRNDEGIRQRVEQAVEARSSAASRESLRQAIRSYWAGAD